MASKGFIELLRLADLAKTRSTGLQSGKGYDWRGVVFEVGDQRLVAPMGEVSEVLNMPEYTSMPMVEPWLLGLANIRGRLLPLTDLPQFLHLPNRQQKKQRKVLIIDNSTVFSGLVVDKVIGIEQFTRSQYRAETLDSDSPFAPYNHGKFVKDQQDWFVFMPSLLAKDPRYIDAAV